MKRDGYFFLEYDENSPTRKGVGGGFLLLSLPTPL